MVFSILISPVSISSTHWEPQQRHFGKTGQKGVLLLVPSTTFVTESTKITVLTCSEVSLTDWWKHGYSSSFSEGS